MIEGDYAKVEGHPSLIRDIKTNAILNTDSNSLLKYNYNKSKFLDQKNKNETFENDISELKKSIDEIKFMLKEILNGS
jgi:hypothetical protein